MTDLRRNYWKVDYRNSYENLKTTRFQINYKTSFFNAEIIILVHNKFGLKDGVKKLKSLNEIALRDIFTVFSLKFPM